MAKQRNYAAEYQARQERAIARGYSGYSAERIERKEFRSTAQAEANYTGVPLNAKGGYNAAQLAAHFEAFTAYDIGMKSVDSRSDYGEWIRSMKEYFVDYIGMTEADALAAAYEIANG